MEALRPKHCLQELSSVSYVDVILTVYNLKNTEPVYLTVGSRGGRC